MDGWNGVGYEVGNFLNFDLFALAFRFLFSFPPFSFVGRVGERVW